MTNTQASKGLICLSSGKTSIISHVLPNLPSLKWTSCWPNVGLGSKRPADFVRLFDSGIWFSILEPVVMFMAMYLWILSPSHEVFIDAPHWPSDQMISLRSLIGHTPPPPPPPTRCLVVTMYVAIYLCILSPSH